MLQISEFQNIIAKNQGIFRYNRFYVVFDAPNVVDQDHLRDIRLLCNTTSLPGRSLATSDQKYNGSIRKIARESIYNEITFGFYATNSLNERKIFEDWIEFINPKTDYSVEYYNTYVKDIKIYTFNDTVDNNVTTRSDYAIALREAYPISIDAINLNWNNQNDAITSNVTFAYREWERITTTNYSY